MDDILLIDKPSGITSFDVIRKLRGNFAGRAPKMGHAGTLDPLASGLLIIGLNKATKRLAHFMNMPKTYEVAIEFGKVSDTYDAAGNIENSAAAAAALNIIKEEFFEKTLQQFIGKISQMPPDFSAKRINGKRAYDLARKGISPQLKPQTVEIYSLEITNWDWPFVSLRVKCGKGTYIRSLAHDLGQKLGCGGYVKELRRTAIGDFKVEQAVRP